MVKFTVLTPWLEDADGLKKPKVFEDYPMSTGDKWMDTTGQPVENLMPDPNLYAIEAITSGALHTMIASDTNYLILSEEIV